MKTNRFPQFPHQPGYPGSWRGRFARLTPIEADLMRWYLTLHADDVLQCWYDVRADGNPATDDTAILKDLSADPAMHRMWYHQTAKRLDAITLEREGYRLIELRQHAAQQTVGEMTTYDTISRSEWPDLTWLPTRLITLSVDPIIRRTLAALGFDLIVAPPHIAFTPNAAPPR